MRAAADTPGIWTQATNSIYACASCAALRRGRHNERPKAEALKEFKAEVESGKRAKEASLDNEKELNSLRNELSSKELEADILMAKQLKLKWTALILTALIIIFVLQTKHSKWLPIAHSRWSTGTICSAVGPFAAFPGETLWTADRRVEDIFRAVF